MNSWQIPCVRGVIGDWVFYSTLMNAKQISEEIQTSKNIREAKSLEDFLQRDLKSRVKGIAKYLLQHPEHFFNSIVVGVFDALPQWIQFDLGKAASDLDLPNLSAVDDSLGVLVFDGREKMFAIDGQHRVEGIKLAFKKSPEKIARDQYSVILVAHIDDKSGKIRTRRLFSDINNNAVKVSNGDKVVIDEYKLDALVARKIYAEYHQFRDRNLIAITEQEQLPDGDTTHFSNLLTLYAVNKQLKKTFRRRKGVPEYDPTNVKALFAIAEKFYNFAIDHEPSFNKFFVAKKTTLAKERMGNRNVLFRPIGLVLLAKLYAHFEKANKLTTLADHLRDLKFPSPGGLFDGVLWYNGQIEAKAANRAAAFDLCLYMLGELNQDRSSMLLEKLKKILKDTNYRLPKPIVTTR